MWAQVQGDMDEIYYQRIRQNVPKPFQDIILGCLSVNPLKRKSIADTLAMLKDLKREYSKRGIDLSKISISQLKSSAPIGEREFEVFYEGLGSKAFSEEQKKRIRDLLE
jgi:serine/threonine protein kinase